MTASTRTPPVGNEGNGTTSTLRADGGFDRTTSDRDHAPSPETYRRRALQGAAADVATQSAHVADHLGTLENRLHDGHDPTPDDLLGIQHLLHGSAESLVTSLDALAVGDEPAAVVDLRHLALGSNAVLLYATHALATERQLNRGPYANGARLLDRVTESYALLDAHGGVSRRGEPSRPLDARAFAALNVAFETDRGRDSDDDL